VNTFDVVCRSLAGYSEHQQAGSSQIRCLAHQSSTLWSGRIAQQRLDHPQTALFNLNYAKSRVRNEDKMTQAPRLNGTDAARRLGSAQSLARVPRRGLSNVKVAIRCDPVPLLTVLQDTSKARHNCHFEQRKTASIQFTTSSSGSFAFEDLRDGDFEARKQVEQLRPMLRRNASQRVQIYTAVRGMHIHQRQRSQGRPEGHHQIARRA